MRSNKILITGAGGFIGTNLARELVRLGNEVISLDRKMPQYGIPIISDITDPSWIDKVGKVDYVFHLAATVGVDYVSAHPFETMNTEIFGINNIVQHAIKYRPKKIIFTSSSVVYGVNTNAKEDSPVTTTSTYGVAKYLAEIYLQELKKKHDIDYSVCRIFNAYGPDQSTRMVVSKFIDQARKNEPITLYARGEQTRDFCVTGDTLILTKDLKWKQIKDIKAEEGIISFDEKPKNKKRFFCLDKVSKCTSYISDDVYEITTTNGKIKATGNHPWLMSRKGFRTTTELLKNIGRRNHNQKLRKISEPHKFYNNTFDYIEGYVIGAIMGDGYISSYNNKYYRVGLEVTDKVFRDMFHQYCIQLGLSMRKRERQFKYPNCKKTYISLSCKKEDYDIMKNRVTYDFYKNKDYIKGWLAGIYDSEGEYDNWQLRISNKDNNIIRMIKHILDSFNFKYSIYKREDGLKYMRILGGLNEHIRFFSIFQPKINRKRPDMNKREVKGETPRVISIEKLTPQRVYNIEVKHNPTYIANGFLCHNTYITDIIDVFIRMAEYDKANGEVFNIGCGRQVKLVDLANMIKKMTKSKSRIIFMKSPDEIKKFDSIHKRGCDNSKVIKTLKKTKWVLIEDGLRKIV